MMGFNSAIFGPTERRSFWTRFLPYIVLSGITFVLYAPSIYFDFVWDDSIYVVQNYQIQAFNMARLASLWRHAYFENYAPIHETLLATLYAISGLDPIAYHICQLLLQTICVCLLYFLLTQIETYGVAIIASLLFAVFPPNIENVAWVSETKSTLALAFFLLSFTFFERFRKRERSLDAVVCILLFSCSLLTKIGGIVAPAVFIFYDYWKGSQFSRKRIFTHAILFLIAISMAVIHLKSATSVKGDAAQMLVHGAITNIQLPLDAVTSYFGGLGVHLLNMPLFFFFYVRMIFVPYPLTVWQLVPIYNSLTWQVGLGWGTLLVLFLLALRCPRRVQFWLFWFTAFLAPVLQLIPNSAWVADRYLYIPAIAAFMLIAYFIVYLWESLPGPVMRTLSITAFAVIVGVFAWTTYRHLAVWQNNITLWTDATKYCGDSALCPFQLGNALLLTEHPEQGIPKLERSAEIRPTRKNLMTLADAYTDKIGNYPKALAVYRRIQNNGGVLPLTFLVSVSKAFYLSGDLAGANRVAEAGLKMSPSHSSLLFVNGFVQWKLGKLNEAKLSIQHGIQLNSINPLAAHPAQFLNYFWEHPSEVGELMHDLGPL